MMKGPDPDTGEEDIPGTKTYLDSGATAHLTPLPLHEVTSTANTGVKMGNGAGVISTGRGTAVGMMKDTGVKVTMRNALNIPSLTCTLMSVAMICDLDAKVVFEKKGGYIDRQDGSPIIRCPRVGNLYSVPVIWSVGRCLMTRELSSEEVSQRYRQDPREQARTHDNTARACSTGSGLGQSQIPAVVALHNRLGHPGLSVMKKLIGRSFTTDPKTKASLRGTRELHCEPCIKAKSIIKSTPKKSESAKSTKIYEITGSDLAVGFPRA